MIVGEIDENTRKLQLQFIPVDEKEFIEDKIDITNSLSQEEIIEEINNKEYDSNKYIKIILTGSKKIEINTNEILKNIVNNNIIKIKDKTKIAIDIESLANQKNLKGIFIKNMLERLENDSENKELIYKAIELGINAFEN